MFAYCILKKVIPGTSKTNCSQYHYLLIAFFFNLFTGIHKFHLSSIGPYEFPSDIDIILLVVTRWKDLDNRLAIRKSWGRIARSQTNFKFKLLFVMNFDKYANVLHHMKIHKENRKYKDLIITKVVDNYKTVGKVLQKFFEIIKVL